MDASKLVTDTLARGFGRLMFPGPLEQRFRRDGAAQRLLLVQIAGVSSVVFFSGVVLADLFMIPDRIGLALALRVGVFAPVCLAGLWLFSRFSLPVLMEWAVAGAGALAAGISLVLSLSSHSPQALAHLVILNVVVVYATMIGRFWPMLVMCLLVAAGHGYAVVDKGEVFSGLGMSTSLLLLSTMVFTLYGNYTLEHSDRKVYLLDLQETELQTELAQANAALARSVRTDPLTGLANRRHFDDVLGQVWAHAQSQGTSMALMLIDIDHFKAYNDHHGHPAGDRCLCAVGDVLTSTLRKSGSVVARWGGEEFAVVMAHTSAQAARATAERVVQAVRAAQLPHEGMPTAPIVTVSAGVAALIPTAGLAPHELIQQADAALYRAKAAGRDRAEGCGDTDDPALRLRAQA